MRIIDSGTLFNMLYVSKELERMKNWDDLVPLDIRIANAALVKEFDFFNKCQYLDAKGKCFVYCRANAIWLIHKKITQSTEEPNLISAEYYSQINPSRLQRECIEAGKGMNDCVFYNWAKKKSLK